MYHLKLLRALSWSQALSVLRGPHIAARFVKRAFSKVFLDYDTPLDRKSLVSPLPYAAFGSRSTWQTDMSIDGLGRLLYTCAWIGVR